MKKIVSHLFCLSLFLMFSGCLVGPKYTRPDLSSPSAFINGTADSSKQIKLEWKTLFNDPSLIQLVDAALNENPDVKIALVRIEQSRAALGITKADRLPALGYNGSANRTDNSDIPAKTEATEYYSVAGTLSWEIDFWGKYRHASRAAQNQLFASESGYKAVRNLIAETVITTYYQLRDMDERLAIALRTRDSRSKYYEIIKSRFEGGDVSELDKLQAEQQLAISEAAVPNFERQITILENALSILTGKNPGEIIRGQQNKDRPTTIILPEGIPSDLLETRPDVKFAEYLYIAETEKIGIAQAQRFPSFNLTAAFGLASPELSTLIGSDAMTNSVTGGLLGPIFNFGKNKRRVELQRKIAEEAMLNYKKTYLQALSEVESSLKSTSTYRTEYEARSRQALAASKALLLSQARYDNGYTSYLEVLDAQRSLLDAEIQQSATLQLQLVSVVNAYKAIGGSW